MKPSHPVRGAEESAEASSAPSSASRTPKARTALAVLFVAGCLGGFAASLLALPRPADASRNSSGVYSLPSGNPVVSGTTITSNWANTTLTDMGTELTNSLDRAGRGGMTGALQCSNGSAPAPALTFVSEPSSGLYRAGAGDVRMSIGGTDQTKWTSTGPTALTAFTANNGITVTQATTNGAGVTATGNGTGAGVTATGGGSSGNGGTFTGGATNGTGVSASGTGTGNGISATGGSGGGTGGSFTASGAGNAIRGDASGSGVAVLAGAGGLKVGSSGTVITASYGATYNLASGNILAASCNVVGSGSQTLTGVATGGVCSVSTDTGHGFAYPYCYVNGANTVVIEVCNPTGSTISTYTDNFRVRVFQP